MLSLLLLSLIIIDHFYISKIKVEINYTKQTKKNVQLEHFLQVCQLSSFARLLSNMYFLNFSWKLWCDIVYISCLLLLGKFLNISFASQVDSNWMLCFYPLLLVNLVLPLEVGSFSTTVRCSGMFSLVKPLYTIVTKVI